MATIHVPRDYGYVVLIVVISFFVNVWHQLRVVAARKKYAVNYPTMYSADHHLFNCIQRSHQNYLENYPFFLVLLIFGGLVDPRTSALGGAIFLTGRIVYTLGYSTGNPVKRLGGAFQYIGYVTLLFTIKLAFDLLYSI